MRFVIFLFVITVFGVHGDSPEFSIPETLSIKEQIRLYNKHRLTRTFSADVNDLCTHYLSPAQTAFGNQKLNDFVVCGNNTIDTFIDSLDFEITKLDVETPQSIQKFVRPLCQVFDNIFQCIRDVEPLIDLCISEDERIFKQRLFTNVPLLKRTVCLKNGDVLANLLGHDDGLECLEETYNWMSEIAFDDRFRGNITVELFGSETLCREFNRLLLETSDKLGECSLGVLNIASEMLSYLCEGTQCHRFITDLKC